MTYEKAVSELLPCGCFLYKDFYTKTPQRRFTQKWILSFTRHKNLSLISFFFGTLKNNLYSKNVSFSFYFYPVLFWISLIFIAWAKAVKQKKYLKMFCRLTWGRVNDDRIVILTLSPPLTICQLSVSLLLFGGKMLAGKSSYLHFNMFCII